MGNCREIVLLTTCVVVLLMVGHQSRNLSANVESLKVRERSMMKEGVPSLFISFTEMTTKEIHTAAPKEGETPILDLLSTSLDSAIPVLARGLSEDLIEVVVSHTGFFPSNFLETADALFNYFPKSLFSSLKYLMNGMSGTYWNQWKRTYNYDYLNIGNSFQVASQVFDRAYGAKSIGYSTDIPTEDSWLGNYLISLPNITFQTAANSSSWESGFGNASTIFHNLGLQTWSGHYLGDGGDTYFWDCYNCQDTFDTISLQMSIISQAPLFAFNPVNELASSPPLDLAPVMAVEGTHAKHQKEEKYRRFTKHHKKHHKKHHTKPAEAPPVTAAVL